LILGHTEEVGGFLHFLEGEAGDRVLEIGEGGFIFRDEGLLADVVPARVFAVLFGEGGGGGRGGGRKGGVKTLILIRLA
jgi:hypothetical protein